jgi:hypothetical protein
MNVPYGRGRTIPSVAELESARQGLPGASHRGTDDQPPPAPLPKPRPFLARMLMAVITAVLVFRTPHR